MAKAKVPHASLPYVSHERLTNILSYNRRTGIFRWKVEQSRRNHIGDQAGTVGADGYRCIQIDGRHYYAHVLAWFYVYGVWPERLDHRDTHRDNNRIKNLRLATHAQNCRNSRRSKSNTTGFKGVRRTDSRFSAAIRVDGVRHYLGRFDTAKQAHDAYCAKALELHGEFARFE